MTRIAIIGAGTMGHGIAYVSAVAGFDVILTDVSQDTLDAALAHIRAALESGVKRGKLTEEATRNAMLRVSVSGSLRDAVAEAAVVIEAAPEKLALKQNIFQQLSRVAPRNALLATNTSSLSVSAIAEVTDCAERVLGMHFFNPVPAMKLVEIVRGSLTSEDAVDRARAVVQTLGKTAIVVGDSPGFATSRLGVVLGLEAMRMLEQGVAGARDIDTAMELGYNHPVGPLRLTDMIGLDVRLAVADHLRETLGDSRYEAPAILRELVRDGKLGEKSGQGFYSWPHGS